MTFATVIAVNARDRSRRLAFLLVFAVVACSTAASAGDEGNGPVFRDASSELRFVVPYQPGKVPVVFIHGLFGCPGNWSVAIDKLYGDRLIGDQFQFLTFRYDSLQPIPESGLRLCESLSEARRLLDPKGSDRSFDEVVLVGHSMGGLVAKVASQFPNPKVTAAMDSLSGQRPPWLAPQVGRVIFIATPHRGSPVDRGAVRSAGLWLARSAGARSSSVAQLTWDNPLLVQLERSRSAGMPPFHSIIAALGDPSAEGATDGIVPVASARLGGAQSELVVPAHHMCTQHPDVIRELRRVLIEHAAHSTLPTIVRK
jgi:pimeloyl-ACP methyl ester carboxylesterase